jgi:hypothetical protein
MRDWSWNGQGEIFGKSGKLAPLSRIQDEEKPPGERNFVIGMNP